MEEQSGEGRVREALPDAVKTASGSYFLVLHLNCFDSFRTLNSEL